MIADTNGNTSNPYNKVYLLEDKQISVQKAWQILEIRL